MAKKKEDSNEGKGIRWQVMNVKVIDCNIKDNEWLDGDLEDIKEIGITSGEKGIARFNKAVEDYYLKLKDEQSK